MSRKKSALGRGLDALLGDAVDASRQTQQQTVEELPLESVVPGPYQPRRHFDQDKLAELASSIRAQGLVQPIVVRLQSDGRYALIAGERRWRAAQMAQLRTIPAIVREVSDQVGVALALIENIQREDLSPMEESLALKRLIDEFDLTHQQAADAVGRSRVAVSNLLRLLELSPDVRTLLDDRKIEMGHARALLTLTPALQSQLAHAAVVNGWSVREIEAQARRAQQSAAGQPERNTVRRDPDLEKLERELAETLATPVALSFRGGRGKLTISYSSLDQLDGILGRLR
jgi:ParB family chromosome partitioning protein